MIQAFDLVGADLCVRPRLQNAAGDMSGLLASCHGTIPLYVSKALVSVSSSERRRGLHDSPATQLGAAELRVE